MGRSRLRLWIAAATFATATSVASTATAQYTHDPFFESMQLLSQAYGLEMAGQRLTLVEAFDPPVAEELSEQIEKMTGPDFARFGGTLAERSPELAVNLLAALRRVVEAVEDGENATALVAAARTLHAEAYDIVIDPSVRAQPAFIGAVLAVLLLGESGVAEGYEEAVEELWEFPNGWAALQRVNTLWTEVEPLATPTRREDGREMIVALNELFPSPEPPETFAGKNPEEAEAPAQRLVGILEEVVDAGLYTGRDMPRLAGHLSEVVAASCQAYAAGNDAMGAEGVYAVYDHYATHLGNLLGLIAPGIHERATGLFDDLIEATDDDDDEHEGDEGGGEEAGRDDDGAGLPPAEGCRELMEVFREARSAVGG